MPLAEDAAARGMLPGGLKRNKEYVGPHVDSKLSGPLYDLLCDPQTSGGLLIALPRGRAGDLLDALSRDGIIAARQIGEVEKRLKALLIVR